MFYLLPIGCYWSLHFGFFHDLWNSIRNAAKIADQGRVWKAIAKFAAVANLNHGPYRTDQWRRVKEAMLKRWCERHNSTSEDFRAYAREQARAAGRSCTTDAEYESEFRRMSSLPSCEEAGPILKFARWMSIQETYEYYRPELWGIKAIMGEWDEADVGIVDFDTTAMVDAELAHKMTADKGGLLKRAPSYICRLLIRRSHIS